MSKKDSSEDSSSESLKKSAVTKQKNPQPTQPKGKKESSSSEESSDDKAKVPNTTEASKVAPPGKKITETTKKATETTKKVSSSSSSEEKVKTPTLKKTSSSSESDITIPKINDKPVKAKKGGSSDDSSEELHIVKPGDDGEKGQKRKKEPEDTSNKKRKLDTSNDGNSSGNVRVRVGNLAFALEGNENDLKDQFKSCGTITKVEMINKRDGRFAGVAILDFESTDAAAKALELHDQPLYDRKMNVSYANEEKNFGGNQGGRGGGRAKPLSPKPEGCTTVWIGNLSYEIEENEVYEFFADCGEVIDVRWPRGEFTGIGWVEFSDTNAPDLAVVKAGTKIRGRDIRIDYAAPRKNA